MTDVNSKAEKTPENAQYRSKPVKKVLFDDVVGRFVDKCVMADPAQEDLWQHSQAQQ